MNKEVDDKKSIKLDLQAAFAFFGKYLFRYFPKEGYLQLSSYVVSTHDTAGKITDLKNNHFIDNIVDSEKLFEAMDRIADGAQSATVVLHAKEGTDAYRISLNSSEFDEEGKTTEAVGIIEKLDHYTNRSEMVSALGNNFHSIYYVDVDNDKVYTYRVKD